jgi:RNA polymerase II subunit A-like phosphatase
MSDDDGPTAVALPPTLPYPITISRIISFPGTTLSRGQHLFEYTFTSSSSIKALARRAKKEAALPGDKDAKEGDMVGTWDSELQGELASWEGWVKVRTIVERTQAGCVWPYLAERPGWS